MSSDLAVVNTVDFFPPIEETPTPSGRIAAANALSDVYAMGGDRSSRRTSWARRRRCRGKPSARSSAGYEAAFEAGAIIPGGHSIHLTEPCTACGDRLVRPDRMLKNSGARPGDALILTKPRGSAS